MYPRFVERRIQEALADTRAVMICGPRQSGKTTLAQQVADANRPFVTLDEATALRAATADPVGFVRGFDRAVIDEVQCAPDLILAIKAAVDEDPRPGRFLLTGSANLMTLPRVADSLAGRMSIIRLLPLAQAELRGKPSSFLADAFAGKWPQATTPAVGDDEVDIVIEDDDGRIVGVEVKASATVSNGDFSGMRRLASACGDRFVLGLVLYDHSRTVPFGERLVAAPVSTLWSGE